MIEHKVCVKRFYCGGETYVLTKAEVKGEIKYFAINYKYLDDEGKLTKELCGLEMFMRETLADTMRQVEQYHKMREYVAQGYSDVEAACLAAEFIPEVLKMRKV